MFQSSSDIPVTETDTKKDWYH